MGMGMEVWESWWQWTPARTFVMLKQKNTKLYLTGPTTNPAALAKLIAKRIPLGFYTYIYTGRNIKINEKAGKSNGQHGAWRPSSWG